MTIQDKDVNDLEFLGARLVIIESPYAGNVYANITYARAAMKDCLDRGEAPFASHLLYTQHDVLDDAVPEQRKMGMNAGFAWAAACNKTVVYTDLGISEGMKKGIENASMHGHIIEFRSLPDWVK